MFRLHKNRQSKSGEKIDFKFSNFKAIQVPKGWDKLFVSIVSEQSGKTIVKSNKASVRNGCCQWTESLSESIWVSRDEISKEFQDCNFKLIVAMGSARSNVLGEAMVNMTNYYTDSRSPSALSLPLKKCSSGTILQVKIQCLNPITKVRNGDLKQTDTVKEDLKKDGQDSDSCLERADSQLSKSIGYSSDADLGSSLHSGEASSKEASFSASNSQLSYESTDVSETMENYSVKNSFSDIERQDSASSQSSAPSSSPNSVITSSAGGTTIEELRAEAKMWERNARKLMVNLDQSRKEFLDQSQNQESLNSALSAATAECDILRKELEQFKLSTEKLVQRQSSTEDVSYDDGEPHMQKELKDELKFQKECNADLALQLKRSQESNIELVSVLQELEATIEKQRLEMEELSTQRVVKSNMEDTTEENKRLMLQLEHEKESEKNLQLKVQLLQKDLEESEHKKYSEEDMVSRHSVDINLVKQIEMLKEKVQELEKDCNELTDENLELLYKLKQANNNSKEGLALNYKGSELLSNSFVNFEFDSIGRQYSTKNLEEKLEEIPRVIENNDGIFNKEVEIMKFELEVKVEEADRELTKKKLVIENLESTMLLKEEKIKMLEDLLNQLQFKYSDLQKEKNQIEEQMEVMVSENDINSKCLDELRNDVKVLSNTVDMHASANKILEKKSFSLECEKRKLELHISQMEQEHIQLSASIPSLESQLRYMIDQKESINLELENSKSHSVRLQAEIDRLSLETETETGSVNLKQVLTDLKNQCAQARDECEHLQRENTKLEAAAEHLIKERNLLQNLNKEVMNKNIELHESYTRLESKLKESHESFSRKIDDFEDSFAPRLEYFATKAKFLSSGLDSLVEENRKYKEILAMYESLYNETYLESETEVQRLQEAVVHLTKQLSATQNDSNLAQMESDVKLSSLISELSMSKQNQEILIADNKKVLKQLENYKSLELELKNSVDDLELKLSVSEKEQQQHVEELSNLNVQLQKMANVQDEAFALKNKFEASKNEREKAEARVKMISKECEDLKTENNSLLEKVRVLQETVSEFEDTKHLRVPLEEKLSRLESGTVGKEASFSLNGDLRHELSQIKRANSGYQQKLQVLEEEKDELLRRSQALEAELKLVREEKQNKRDHNSVKVQGVSKTNGKNTSSKDMKLHKNDAVKVVSQNHNGKKKSTSKHDLLKDPKDPNTIQSSPIRDDHECDIKGEGPLVPTTDSVSRIQLLEKELAEALEANKNYKEKLSRLSSGNQNIEASSPQVSMIIGGGAVAKESYESTNSVLEAELKDMRERYFHISLKYAEVEHQREELVMKLKAAKTGRRWFS